MFETKQYCGLINLKRDMLYYVRCIYTVSLSIIALIGQYNNIILLCRKMENMFKVECL